MSTTDKATPRPWVQDAFMVWAPEAKAVVAAIASPRPQSGLVEYQPLDLGDPALDEAYANAALIVRAVNNHEAALELLEDAEAIFDAMSRAHQPETFIVELRDRIRILLASARGEAQG